jgi:hypothetical protein
MTSYDVDQKYKTDYFERFKKYLIHVQDSNEMVVGGMTDPKGDRSLPPSKQADPDLFTHVVERRSDERAYRRTKLKNHSSKRSILKNVCGLLILKSKHILRVEVRVEVTPRPSS